MSQSESKTRAGRKEVAALANVSEATVSFVYSKKRYVSDELKERVLHAAERLDYQPDLIARSMVTKITETIAVLTSDMASPLQMEIIKSIQSEAMKKGFYVYVCGGDEHLEKYIDNFIARRVDGVFLSVVSSFVGDNYITKMLDRGISVMINSARSVDDSRICGIELDFVEGMRLIVRHLQALHHKKVAYVSCYDAQYRADKRLKGFTSAVGEILGDANPLIECGVAPYESTIEVGYGLTKKLSERSGEFTALVCTNDLMAMGAVAALREAGLKVPQDVSVVGIDDIQFSKAFDPPLTTLNHSAKEYGKKIFEILHRNIGDKTDVGRSIVRPELVVRQSTAECKERIRR